MEQQDQQYHFSGWAIIEIMGHQITAGYATTVYFGGTAMLRVVLAEQPTEEITLQHGHTVNYKMLAPGSRVRRSSPHQEEFIGVQSIYRLRPATEQECQRYRKVTWEILEEAASPTLLPPTNENADYDDEDQDEVPY